MIALPPDALRGSMPPLVTPFRDGEVDYDAYAGLVEPQARAGSHGIVVCGTTAEPSLLSVPERHRLAEVAIDVAAGRVQVIVATGSQSMAETIELSDHADRAGADALLIVTPYYVRPPQRGLVAYFVALARRTERPVLLYHIPGRAAVDVTIDTLTAIVDAAPNVVGMKHAVNDLGLVNDALARLGPDFRVHVGLEELSFPMLAIGAAGMVNAVGNLVPERLVAMYDAMRDGKLDEGRRWHEDLLGLNRSIFFEMNPIPLKYMMRRLGLLPTNEHRLPMVPASAETERRCDAVLAAAGLIDSTTAP